MKILLLNILLLFISSLCFSEIHGSFEIGKDLVHEENQGYIKIDLQYDIDIWKFEIMPYGSWTSWVFLDDIFKEQQLGLFRDVYEFGLKLTLEPFYVDLNHYCNHAVYTTYSQKNWLDMRWQDAMTTLSVGIEW